MIQDDWEGNRAHRTTVMNRQLHVQGLKARLLDEDACGISSTLAFN